MRVPEILGVEVITPDGRGSILSLHNGRVIICLHKIERNQVMKGSSREFGEMHYAYKYEDVEIIKGQYCFNDERISSQYEHIKPSSTGE